VTRAFCGACSRLRVTAEGKVRPCLFSHEEWDLKPLLRNGATDRDVACFIADSMWTKQAGHGIGSDGFSPPQRTMSAIGG
jgi:cyclic pyranopterin phosphate synthase